MALKPETGGSGGGETAGGPKLSSVRPWWDLCRGARYTAFRTRDCGGGGGRFMSVRGWELLIFSKTGVFSPGLK